MTLDHDNDIAELAAEVRADKRRETMRCQCDETFGTCPGPANCPQLCDGDDE